MIRLWKLSAWLFEYWYCWGFAAFMMLLIYGAFVSPPTSKRTTRADCTYAMELHEKEIERLLDCMLNLQTELIIAREQLKIREQLDMDGYVEDEGGKCSKCDNQARPNQRYCKACHAEYSRTQRKKNALVLEQLHKPCEECGKKKNNDKERFRHAEH